LEAKLKQNAPTRKAPSLDDVIDARIEAKLAEMHGPTFGWVRCGAATISPKQAHALARQGRLRVTKIGKYLFVHRADLEARAAANVVRAAPANDAPDPFADLDPAVAAAVRAAAGGGR